MAGACGVWATSASIATWRRCSTTLHTSSMARYIDQLRERFPAIPCRPRRCGGRKSSIRNKPPSCTGCFGATATGLQAGEDAKLVDPGRTHWRLSEFLEPQGPDRAGLVHRPEQTASSVSSRRSAGTATEANRRAGRKATPDENRSARPGPRIIHGETLARSARTC